MCVALVRVRWSCCSHSKGDPCHWAYKSQRVGRWDVLTSGLHTVDFETLNKCVHWTLLPSKQDHSLGIYPVELCIFYRWRPFDQSHGANRELKILTPALKLLVHLELQKFCACSFPGPFLFFRRCKSSQRLETIQGNLKQILAVGFIKIT